MTGRFVRLLNSGRPAPRARPLRGSGARGAITTVTTQLTLVRNQYELTKTTKLKNEGWVKQQARTGWGLDLSAGALFGDLRALRKAAADLVVRI